MELAALLSELKRFLATNHLLVEKPIKEIDKSCCQSQTLVIDFDALKEAFCKKLKISSLASVDCLYIDEKQGQLLFIEMKNLEKHLEYQRKKKSKLDDETFIKQSFEQFELGDKIVDSYTLMIAISGYYSFLKEIYPYLLDKDKLKIKFILLAEITNRDFVKYRISNLPTLLKMKFRFLTTDWNIIRAEEFDNLLKNSK